MRRRMLVVMLAAALTVAAGAQVWPPRLIGSFPAPPGAWDVAYEYRWLYVLTDGTPPRVYQLTTTGSTNASFPVPVPAGARGIACNGFSPDRMFISNRLNGYIYKLTMEGSLLSSFLCPVGSPYGLGFSEYYSPHGIGLFASCRDRNLILRLNDTTGSLLSSFAGPSTAVVGFDDFFAGVRNSNYVYWDYYGRWQVFDTMPARPYGVGTRVEWPIDQTVYLYVLCGNAYIYQYFGWTAVAPASLGRVKALFR
ncbi:MAG: hypothetical protein V3T41_01350 [bacterium]